VQKRHHEVSFTHANDESNSDITGADLKPLDRVREPRVRIRVEYAAQGRAANDRRHRQGKDASPMRFFQGKEKNQ
jgi:hypothetical protein